MEYSKLISVTGLPGLFELVASKSDGAIVRSLDDKSTKFISSRVHNFSHLESIEVYTEGDNVNLVDVFQAMLKSSEKLPDEKDAKAVKTYFEKTYPEMDFSRVYASDMKKMIKWFDVLKKNDIEIKLTEPEEEVQEVVSEEPVEKVEEVVAEPKKAAKKSATKETKQEEVEIKSEEPKKAKAAKTKKAEPATSTEDAPTETETKAAKKKVTKK